MIYVDIVPEYPFFPSPSATFCSKAQNCSSGLRSTCRCDAVPASPAKSPGRSSAKTRPARESSAASWETNTCDGKSGMRMFRISMFFYNDGFLILMMFWYGKTNLFAAFISSLPIFGNHFSWRAAKTPLFSMGFHCFPLSKRRLSIAIHAIAKQAQGFRGGHRFSEINLLNDLISSKGSTWSTAIFA